MRFKSLKAYFFETRIVIIAIINNRWAWNTTLYKVLYFVFTLIQIPGRTYKIDVEYIPVVKDRESNIRSNKIDPSPYIRLMQNIDNKYPEDERGDLLIFLSGLSDIQTICDAASEYAAQTKRWIILPLHSTLSIEAQEKVFDIPPYGVRKCILCKDPIGFWFVYFLALEGPAMSFRHHHV